MIWIKPKMDWIGSPEEFFNADPDYDRITNNIRVIYEEAKKYYRKEFTIFDMPKLVVNTDHMYVDYLNCIVYNLDIIQKETFRPLDYTIVGVFQDNSSIWNFKDLNAIERNTLYLHNSIVGKGSLEEKVGYAQMGWGGVL